MRELKPPALFNFKKMYRADAIRENFLHLLGWRQNYNTADFAISESLTKSETGQYYQDMHPLITLDTIRSISPNYGRNTYKEWDSASQYKPGQLASVEITTDNPNYTDFEKEAGFAVYRALTNNTGKEPEASPEDWTHVDLFSEWLEEKTAASILKAVESYYSVQLADRTVKNLLESKVLFDGAGRLVDVVRNTNSFVGFEIIPIRAEGVTLKVEKIGVQFNKNGKFNLYLMHNSSPQPIKVIPVDYTKNGGMQWIDMEDLYLPYISDNTDAGGSWFLCYSQKELPSDMQAVEKNRDWSKEPCPTCSRIDYLNWQAWSKYLEIHPFKTPAPDTIEMWDVQNNVYTYTTNYGLNLKVTMECDLTDILIAQRKSFQNVIGLQVAADMIREFAYNPNFRINRMQQNFSRNELLYELDGDSTSNKKGGILYRLDKAMEALRIDTTGINRICIPCRNDGIRYRTV